MSTTVSAVRASSPLAETAEVVAPIASIRLLHIEDNPADAALIQAYVQGAVPDVAFDTAACLADVTLERADEADCAILDLSLPDATGLQGLLHLRALAPDLPIIVLTGFDDLPLGLNALSSGAEDYLVKNHVDGYTLQRAIRYAIERRRLSTDVDLAGRAAHVTSTPVAAATGSDAAIGTHEVSVRIDGETGEYSLRCLVCDWESERGSEDEHSWSQRALDATLLYHVDFGGIFEASAQEEGPPELATADEPAESPPPAGDTAVPRRSLFSGKGWLPKNGSALE